MGGSRRQCRELASTGTQVRGRRHSWAASSVADGRTRFIMWLVLSSCTLANLMAMLYDDGYKQGTDSICLDGGSQAPVAFAPPRTRSVMGMRRMAPGAYGSATVRSVHLRMAGTRHRQRSSPRHLLAPARCLRRAGQFRVARKPCLSCE